MIGCHVNLFFKSKNVVVEVLWFGKLDFLGSTDKEIFFSNILNFGIFPQKTISSF